MMSQRFRLPVLAAAAILGLAFAAPAARADDRDHHRGRGHPERHEHRGDWHRHGGWRGDHHRGWNHHHHRGWHGHAHRPPPHWRPPYYAVPRYVAPPPRAYGGHYWPGGAVALPPPWIDAPASFSITFGG